MTQQDHVAQLRKMVTGIVEQRLCYKKELFSTLEETIQT